MSSEGYDEAGFCQTDEILARAKTRIDPELAPEQRVRLQKMQEARKRRLQEWLNIPETHR